MRRCVAFLLAFLVCAGFPLGHSARAQDAYRGNASAPLPLPDEEDAPASIEINAGDQVSAVPKRFQYAFRLNLRGVYDDNIFISENRRVGDYYFSIEPGVTLGFGDIVGSDMNYIRLDYAPSIFLFVDNTDADAVQQLIRLEGRYRLGRLTLTLNQDVQLLDSSHLSAITSDTSNAAPGVNLDAGGDAPVNIYSTNANFSYDLTGKTFLSGALHFTGSDYDGLIDSATISGNLFINYTYSPKLVVGIGATGGYNWVQAANPNQTFEQVNARMTYQVSGKVSLNASGGVEFRQSEENYGAGNYTSPVYEIGAAYQPFDGTSLTLSGSRRTENSAVLAGNNYASTNLTLGVRQRFLRRFYLGLAAGYENSDYASTIQFVDGSRRDNYYFVQPAVDVTLMQFWTVGAFYLHRRNDSSSGPFSFYDNQFGLRTSLIF